MVKNPFVRSASVIILFFLIGFLSGYWFALDSQIQPKLLWSSIVGISFVLLTSIIQFLQATDKTQKIAVGISFVFAVWLFFMTVDSQVESNQKEKVNDSLTNENLTLLKRLDTINSRNSDTLRRISNLQEELKAAQKEIADIQSKRITEILGGNEAPIVDIVTMPYSHFVYNPKTKKVDDSLEHRVTVIIGLKATNFKLKDVFAVITCINYQSIRKVVLKDEAIDYVYETERFVSPFVKEYQLRTLTKEHGVKQFFVMDVPVGDLEYHFNLQCEWTNGFFATNIVLEPTIDFLTIPEKSKYQLKLKSFSPYILGSNIEVKFDFVDGGWFDPPRKFGRSVPSRLF